MYVVHTTSSTEGNQTVYSLYQDDINAILKWAYHHKDAVASTTTVDTEATYILNWMKEYVSEEERPTQTIFSSKGKAVAWFTHVGHGICTLRTEEWTLKFAIDDVLASGYTLSLFGQRYSVDIDVSDWEVDPEH